MNSLTRAVRLANAHNSKTSSNDVAFVLFFVLVLVGFGIVMVFSSTIASETDYLRRHLIFVAAGLGLLGLMSITPLRLLRDNFRWALVLAFFLAIITFFYGVEINGAKRWLKLVEPRFKFQSGQKYCS